MTTPDSLTVLTTATGKSATKQFSLQKDGTIKNRSYGNETYFAVTSVPIKDINSLAHELDKLTRNSRSFVIRGEPLPGTNRARTRRLALSDRKTGEPATFEDQPRHWFSIDVDHIACPVVIDPVEDPEGAVEYVIGLLPPELHDGTCYWQFSSSQSVKGTVTLDAPDSLSLHLWFWSAEPLDNAALTRWALAANAVAGYKLIGPEFFRTVQAHYTAAPLFSAPLKDPLARRSGLRRGLDDAVNLIIPPSRPKRAYEPGRTGYEPGGGVEAHLREIGGPKGFRSPIMAAIASYIAIHGSAADIQPIYRAIREAIARVEPDGDLGRYQDDEHLDKITDWVRQHHGDQPPKASVGEPPPHIVDPEIPTPQQILEAEQHCGVVIRVLGGRRHEAADQGLVALHSAGVPFYRRDRGLVRVCLIKAKNTDGQIIMVPGIMPITPAMLCRALGQSAYWQKINSKNELVRIDPPDKVVEQVMSMVDEWPFPPLSGVITCPTLRPDGSLLASEGYDLATGLVLYKTVSTPPIPECPTRDDAEAATICLCDLLGEFPFVNEASKSVALSLIMTPVLRGAFPVAPMHLTNAPQAGTGKSYLADIASAISTGERCAVISVAPKPEETEKRLIGAALAGYPIIAIDNVRILLEGDFLCQVTERPLMQLRRLGSSEQIRVTNTFTALANGNNATVADDLVRRTISCALDANMENPEKRTFRTNPLSTVMRNRGAYIAACLTIARAYIAAGKPDRRPPLPSYEGWSDIDRSSLVWLGYPDPVETMEAARGADPVREDRSAVFSAWHCELKMGERYLAADLAERADHRYEYDQSLVAPALRDALLSVAAMRGNAGLIDPRRLGIWLKKNENTIACGFKLTADRSDADRPRWALVTLG